MFKDIDDIDLGIVAIVCTAALGTTAGIVMVAYGVPYEALPGVLAFVSVGITAIGSLARGRKKE